MLMEEIVGNTAMARCRQYEIVKIALEGLDMAMGLPALDMAISRITMHPAQMMSNTTGIQTTQGPGRGGEGP